MPTQVNVHEAKSQLSKLIEKVLAGEQVTIARAGKPVVDLVVSAGLAELPLTTTHGATVANFPALLRHDPFDRMLLAQAHVEGMPLLIADRVLLAAAPDLTIDARA